MKKIYYFLTNVLSLALVLASTATAVFAQCPPGETNVDVTYTESTNFNGENSWSLYDATAGVELLCEEPNPANSLVGGPPAGTQSVCVIDGNTIELYAWDEFGDGWCAPAEIEVVINEDASVNGCANPQGFPPGTSVVVAAGDSGGNVGGSATSFYDCSGDPVAGMGELVGSFSSFCPPCEVFCPADITMDTDPGVCSTVLTVPNPTLPPGCVFLETPGNIQTISGAQTPLIGNAGGLDDTPFEISGVSPVDPALDCVTEICFDFEHRGDFDNGTEITEVITEDNTVLTLVGNSGAFALQCQIDRTGGMPCVSVTTYNNWAADGVIEFILDEDGQINTNSLCAGQDYIQGFVDIPTACLPTQVINSFTGMNNAAAEYPIGETCLTLSATGSGNGASFPINCEVCVTIEDNEAPTIDCPDDFTFNLQGGECSQIIDFNEPVINDNCPDGFVFDVENVCDPFAAPSNNWIIQCTGAGVFTTFVTPVNVAQYDGAAITELCFAQGFTQFNTLAAENMTVNFYVDNGFVPFSQGPGTPFETRVIPIDAANASTVVCASLTPVVIPQGVSDIYVEFEWEGADPTPAANPLFTTSIGLSSVCNGMPAAGNSFITCNGGVPGSGANFGPLGVIGPAIGAPPTEPAFNLTFAPVVVNNPNPGPGMVPPGATLNAFESGDDFPIGTHCFSRTAVDASGNQASCTWCYTVNEFPADQVVTSLACNDLVNVSLNEDCTAFISADMFLEGGPYGCYFNCYEVFISGVGGGLVDVNGQDIELAPGRYTVTVNDACRDNSCWGEMVVEDKLPPAMPPIEDIVIACYDDIPELLSAGFVNQAIWPIEGLPGEDITGAEPEQFLSFGVESDCEVEDLNVEIELEHMWVGSMEMDIISPAGTSVRIFDNQCGSLDDMHVTFDDEGALFNCGAAVPGTGANLTVANNNNEFLSDFDGEPINGTWTLRWDQTLNIQSGEFVQGALIFNDGIVECGATISPSDYLSSSVGGCAVVDIEVVQEEVVGSDCTGTTILRTWVATDASGNTTSKTQTITQERIGIDALNDEWFWPVRNIELTCGAETTPDAIYNYFRAQWQASNPCPLPTCDPSDGHNYDASFVEVWECNANAWGVRHAYPYFFNENSACGLQESFLNNACNIFFTYSDQVLPACGAGCSGNNKVIRTWTALDWCTGGTINEVQVISAKDTEGPTASPLKPITVSANPWGCAASFQLPVPEHLSDNCSSTVTYRVYGQPGTITESLAGPRILLDEDDNVVLDANGYPVWVVEGLPKAAAPYAYTYELSDCCGNVSYYTLLVTVVDGAAPVAIAKQNIVISLTSSPTDPAGGSAKLYVNSVDNGSHDGDCGPVRVAIRRTDDGVCGNLGLDGHENNTTFFNFNDLPNSAQPTDHDRDDTDEGQFVKFCCQDLIDGEGEDTDGDGINDYVLIDVELGVWDDANMDGIPGTPGDLFGLTWATVRVEAKLQPTLTCPPLAKITCEMDESDLSVTGGSAHASSTCGNLDVVYEDLCGLDINQDGVISEFTVTDPAGMFINEVGMCTDVNGDGVLANYTAAWWSTVDEDLFNKACHYGPITRWWSIDGTNIKCRQLVIIEEPLDAQRFDGSVSIDWPYSEDEFIEVTDNDGDDCGLMEVSGSDIEQIDTNNDDIPDYAEVRLSCIDGLCDEPSWVNATCSLIGWSLDTDTFYFEDDACRKIINTYTVIDWCQYNPNDPSSGGIWTWTVIGKLIDTYPPIVDADNDMFPAVPGSGGSGTSIDERACVGVGITMSATASDTFIDEDGDTLSNACPSQWLKWNVYVDIYNDWKFDREWSSFVPADNPRIDLWDDDNPLDNQLQYGYGIPDVRVGNEGGVDNNEGDAATPPGFEYTINIPDQIPADCGETTHRVVWKVYDGCGNVSSTTSYFTVQDKKAPTPYCINLSTALMADPDGDGPAESMVELWAIDFDYGSFDNCAAYEDLRFTFTDTQPEFDPDYNHDLRSSARVFTCEDLSGTSDATLTIPVYVWDLCGNYDFCEVNLRLVDNNPDGCTDDNGTGSIAGVIETEFGQSVESVEVSNENMFYEFESTDMTENDGSYAFLANLLNMDYQVNASKNDDYLNGVSTLDLVLIQRHILGLENLDSAYKMIAADVNNDGSVTAIDLIELRKLILGIYEELPSNSSWRFVDAAQTLDISSPWNFDETIDIYDLSTDMMDENFVGIKVGDVNQSVVANSSATSTEDRSASAVSIEFDDIQVAAGQTFDLTVAGDGFNNVYGYQFTLATQGLELITVQSGAVNVTEENFGVHGNSVTTSWNSDKPVSATGALFTMTFKASTSGRISDMVDVNSNITKAEAYVGTNLDIVNIDLANGADADVDFALYQNEPNPFTNNTVIGFEMPQTADATFTILDVTGKVVKTINGNFAKGYNEIELSKSDLGAAGVYYYQLDSGNFNATKKMIIIE